MCCMSSETISLSLLSTERMLEDHDNLVDNILMWSRDSTNKLIFLERPDKYDVFRRPEEYLLGPGGATELRGKIDDAGRGSLIQVCPPLPLILFKSVTCIVHFTWMSQFGRTTGQENLVLDGFEIFTTRFSQNQCSLRKVYCNICTYQCNYYPSFHNLGVDNTKWLLTLEIH